ncbi:hypothetical protein [Dechloromonas sp. A34]|uniref:hypothetical protein n=1 Tax=Dechloromonas sp. A34 TaxID=447588 RepID=UPI002249963D|nr:hypothetical protein [Dechloromonas sp. A34]
MSKIHLHIEHLSLPGYTPAERRALLAALERELAVTAGSATPPADSQRQALRVNAPDLRPQTVARQVVQGLKPGGKTGGGQP